MGNEPKNARKAPMPAGAEHGGKSQSSGCPTAWWSGSFEQPMMPMMGGYPAPLRDMWSGQRESNPPGQLGRLLLHLGAIPAKLLDDEPQDKEAAFSLFKPTYKPGGKINMAFAAGFACQAF